MRVNGYTKKMDGRLFYKAGDEVIRVMEVFFLGLICFLFFNFGFINVFSIEMFHFKSIKLGLFII